MAGLSLQSDRLEKLVCKGEKILRIAGIAIVSPHDFGKTPGVVYLMRINGPPILSCLCSDLNHRTRFLRATVVAAVVERIVNDDALDGNMMSSILVSKVVE